MAEPLAHFARALEELLLGVAASAVSLARLRRALRAEEQRWAAHAGDDPAAERVREIFAALADLLEPPSDSDGRGNQARGGRANRSRGSRSPARGKFDPLSRRWDTRTRWRS
jgi:hypothetical protein